MESSFGRKSERAKKKKRSFSPDEEVAAPSTQSLHKRRKKKHVLPPAYGANRPYDRLSNGMPFCCDLCKSPYVCNPRMSKRGCRTKRSKHQPCPRIKTDSLTGRKLTLCNACGLALDRPKHTKRTPKPTLTEEDKKKYLAEAKRFAATLAKDLKEPEVGGLYCPTIKRTPCKCLQRYILRGRTKEECGVNARLLVSLLVEARRLASLKSYDINQMTVIGKRGKKYRNIGLGNGQKRSKQFEHFVMSKRNYLRNELELCERATQKVLCYSNNFLHKKLKTEERGCRIERVRGKCALGQLIPLKGLYKHHCCMYNCVRMSLTHLVLLEQWRERAQMGQAEARRVLAEMLTPSGGLRQNCYKFISMVTGCSPSTVCKVNDQMKETGGEREPPMHGLRKYWLTCTLKGKMAPMDGSLSTAGNMDEPNTPSSTVSQCTDHSNQETEVTSTSGPDQADCDEVSTSTLNSDVQREKLLQLQQQLLQQQKTIQEQQRIVQAQLLQHTLAQQLTTSETSPQTSLQQSPTQQESSGGLIQQLTSSGGLQPRQMSKEDHQSHPIQIHQKSSAEQSLQTAFQLDSTPDRTQAGLLQHTTKPAGFPMVHNEPLLQTDVSQAPTLYEMRSASEESNCVLLQPVSKQPEGSQPFMAQQFSKEIAPQQTLKNTVHPQGAPDTSKPDGSFQRHFQQMPTLGPLHQQLLQAGSGSGGPPSASLQQLPKLSDHAQVPSVQIPQYDTSVRFTLSGSHQILPPQIQAKPALYQELPNVFQGVTVNQAPEMPCPTSTHSVAAVHNVHQRDPHHVTRDSSALGSELQTAAALHHTNISLQRSSQDLSQFHIPLHQMSSNPDGDSTGSHANITPVPLMILHSGTQNQQIQFPVTSSAARIVSDSNKVAADVQNPALPATVKQGEQGKMNVQNNSSTPVLFCQSRNQGVTMVTPVVPEGFQVRILPPGTCQILKETYRSSTQESGNDPKEAALPALLIPNMAHHPASMAGTQKPEIPGHSATHLAAPTKDKPLKFSHTDTVQQNCLPFIAVNPASVASSGARIQILSPVNLQQIHGMISHGQVQPIEQHNQRQKRKSGDSLDTVQQSRNMSTLTEVKQPASYALSGYSVNKLSVSSSKPCRDTSTHTTDQDSQTGKVQPEIMSLESCGSSHSTVPLTAKSNQSSGQADKSSTARPNRLQNAQSTFYTMAASSISSAGQKTQQVQGHAGENSNHSVVVEPSSFIHIDSKLGRQHLQYSLEPNTNSPLFLQPGSPVMESLNCRPLPHVLSTDDRPISARTLDFDFSCSPLTVSDRDSILSRSRNSSGESIEPTLSLDPSSLPREWLQLFIQHGIPFTISNGQPS